MSNEKKQKSIFSSDDDDKEPDNGPSHHTNTSADNQSRSLSDDPLLTSSEDKATGDETNEVSIIEISSSNEENETFRSVESDLNDNEEEFEINPFNIFPIFTPDPPRAPRVKHNFSKTMAKNSVPLSFINSIAKLGEDKEGNSLNNWTAWSENIRSVLTLQDLWVDIDKPLAELTPDECKISAKAFHIINLAVSDSAKSLVRGLNNSVAAWNALRNHYNRPTVVNKVAIVRKIFNEKLLNADDLEGHILRMKGHFQALADLGEKWSNSMNIAVLLQSLSEEFESLVSSIGAFEEKDVDMDRVVSSLMDEYKRRKSSSLSKAMKSLSFNPGTACGLCRNVGHGPSTCGLLSKPIRHCRLCNKYGHLPSDCFSNNQKKKGNQSQYNGAPKRQQSFNNQNHQRRWNHGNKAESQQWTDETAVPDVDEPESASTAVARAYCYNATAVMQKKKCRRGQRNKVFLRLGAKEIKSEKPYEIGEKKNVLKRKHKDSSSSYSSGSVKLSPNAQVSDDVLDLQCNTESYDDLNKNTEMYSETSFIVRKAHSKLNTWIVDSGATSHMCNNYNLFQNLKYDDNLGYVKIADGKNYSIKGIGTVSLWLKHGNDAILFKLDNVHYIPQFDTNLISVKKLTDQGMSITFDKLGCHAMLDSTSIELAKYLQCGYILNETNNSQNARPCIHEWHKRMAHRNITNIRQNKEKLGLSIAKCTCGDDCIPCIQGKLTAIPFPKQAQKPDNCLDIVVSDVCGPMSVQSLGKSKYFITFIDIFSDYTEVVSIHKKSDAKQCIINYVERLKNSGKKCKVFRSDNGGEYVDKQLIQYMEKEGIKIERTIHDCPQQNGIAERKNRTLCDAVRTMLQSAKLPAALWAEALANAVYTFNRMPRTGLERSPLEMFSGKHRTSFFIEFGAPVFVATTQHGRKKLDDRAVFMRFLSVDEQSKGFRLWDGRTVRVERNVKFLKSKSEILSFDKFYFEAPTQSKSIPPNSVENESELIQHLSSPSTVELRRSKRLIAQQIDKAATVIIDHSLEPKTYKQAINSQDKEKWSIAMEEELKSIKDNNTWSLVDLPQGRKAIGSKWVYKLKRDSCGKITRYKARLVAQGFTQKYGIDYDEVFAPVAGSTTFRTLLSIASKRNLVVRQYDVTSAFLNGHLSEEIYMKPPQGMDIGGKVFKLHGTLPCTIVS